MDQIKREFLTVFIEQGLEKIFPVIFDCENDISLKTAILRITVQLLDYSPKDMIGIFRSFNSPFVSMVNNIINTDDIEQKILTQLALLLMIKLVNYCSQNKMYVFNKFNIRNVSDIGIDFTKATSYVNKTFSPDFVTINLSFGLISELISHPSLGSQFIAINQKHFKTIKEAVKLVQGKGREENKKLEGTNFGFHRRGIIDYSMIYLEKLYKAGTKDKFKADFIQALSEVQFDEVLIDLFSNISYKSDISPKGISCILVLVYELISADYKNLLKRLIKVIFKITL